MVVVLIISLLFQRIDIIAVLHYNIVDSMN